MSVIGRGKTLAFNDLPGSFLILDGQHRVFGFSKATKPLRVPVVIYNGLSRADETRLFVDINTKQRPVPSPLLLDIKRLADIETESEGTLRNIFDLFNSEQGSALAGMLAPFDSIKNKINRTTFNAAVKPLLENFGERNELEIYQILNAYLSAVASRLNEKISDTILAKPVVFRAFLGLFPAIAQRIKDKFNGNYSPSNVSDVMSPLFSHLPVSRLKNPGTSWVALRDYLASRIRDKTF